MRTLRLAATLVVLAAVGGFAATDASGAPITFAYAGVITSVTTPGSPIAAGDRFMVTFTFEGETGPSRSLPNIADYPAVLSASLLVTRGADVVFAWSPPITWSNIEVLNDYQLSTVYQVDGYNIGISSSGGDDSDYVDSYMGVGEMSSDLSRFSSSALSELGTVPPDPSRSERAVFGFQQQHYPTLDTIEAYGEITSVGQNVPVPEPATLLMLGSGLAGACGTKRRRR